MKISQFILLVCLTVGAAAQVWCPNPPGNMSIPASECCSAEQIGLGRFMKSYFELMQIDCMLDIFFDALMFDAEVLDFYMYVSGPEFEKLCLYIQNAREFKDLAEYMCYELHFDPYQYLNTMGSILDIPHMEHPQGCVFEFPLPWFGKSAGPTISMSSQSRNRPSRWPVTPETGIGGVVGLIDVLYYEIPHDEAYDLWLYFVETDEYVCRAVAKMRTPEFEYLVRRLEFNPDYLNFVNQMESYGVNWSSFVDQLKTFLWSEDTPYCR